MNLDNYINHLDKDQQLVIRNAIANVELEGMKCDLEDVKRLVRLAEQKTTLEEELDSIKKQFEKL